VAAGDSTDGLAAIERAASDGRRFGFDQLVSDAHRWTLDRIVDATLDTRGAAQALVPTIPGADRLSEAKRVKAIRYGREPERLELLKVHLRSDSGVRSVGMGPSGWSCDCQLFRDGATCTHIVAVRLLTGR
jgi:hypothetical protein